MANEKILILEAPWSSDITDTRATRVIYSSAETLLSIHDQPIRIIQRPLFSKSYLNDIDNFVSLNCNKRGPNVVVLSAHGTHTFVKRDDGKKHRRELQAFDEIINISAQIHSLSSKLKRTIFILDACEVGQKIDAFRRATGALGAIGFKETVDWVDSSVFVLALLLKFQSKHVLHLKKAVSSTDRTRPLPKKVLDEMIAGEYKSLMESLGVEYSFGD